MSVDVVCIHSHKSTTELCPLERSLSIARHLFLDASRPRIYVKRSPSSHSEAGVELFNNAPIAHAARLLLLAVVGAVAVGRLLVGVEEEGGAGEGEGFHRFE